MKAFAMSRLAPERSRFLGLRAQLRRRAGKSSGGADAEHFFPSRPGIRGVAILGAVDHELRHAIDYVAEIKFRDAIALEVWRRVQEIDCVWDAVLDGELDRVHF